MYIKKKHIRNLDQTVLIIILLIIYFPNGSLQLE
jgi:hypothetical protein